MKVVGLTGGIGSGKTTVANMFDALGIPVYIADKEAKKLTVHSKSIRRDIVKLLGEEAYNGKELDTSFVAKQVFNDEALLQKLNSIIHPKVRSHFKKWMKKLEAPYCIKEAAILFENGGYKECDYMVLVTAPKEVRIDRIMRRDHVEKEDILRRMQHQWSDEKKAPLADFIIHNETTDGTSKQVLEIHKLIMNSLNK
jgi:dephospho-CoA kinase